jgi:hypothetical protein
MEATTKRLNPNDWQIRLRSPEGGKLPQYNSQVRRFATSDLSRLIPAATPYHRSRREPSGDCHNAATIVAIEKAAMVWPTVLNPLNDDVWRKYGASRKSSAIKAAVVPKTASAGIHVLLLVSPVGKSQIHCWSLTISGTSSFQDTGRSKVDDGCWDRAATVGSIINVTASFIIKRPS